MGGRGEVAEKKKKRATAAFAFVLFAGKSPLCGGSARPAASRKDIL